MYAGIGIRDAARYAMNILVTNVYSWRNKGDAAIVLGMLAHLQNTFPAAKFILSSCDPLDAGRYGPHGHVPSFSALLNASPSTNRDTIAAHILTALRGYLMRFRMWLFVRLGAGSLTARALLSAPLQAKAHAYIWADLVVACGGGYLLSTGRRRRIDRWMGHRFLRFVCMDFDLAGAFGKPYILYNQSIGPFADAGDSALAGTSLRGAELVVCRERLSLERVKTLGVRAVEIGTDAAFSLPSRPTDILTAYGYRSGGVHIGLTVRKCLLPDAQRRYQNAIADLLARVGNRYPDVRFYFMPQVICSDNGDDDRLTARAILETLPAHARESTVLVNEDFHPGELKHAIGQMTYFVGTRMHSNIFALSSRVRTVAIAYEPKTRGIMDLLGLGAYVLDASEVSGDSIYDCLLTAISDEKYDSVLAAGLASVAALSRPDLRRYGKPPGDDMPPVGKQGNHPGMDCDKC